MRLIELRAENFKRFRALHVHFSPGMNKITGPNCAGKSSVLDAISFALGGKKHMPKKAIRAGAVKSQVILATDQFRVTRKISETGQTVVVEPVAGGAKYSSPETFLQSVYNLIGFDASTFARLDSAAQAAMLRKVTGIDTVPLDQQRQKLYEQRTQANSEWKIYQSQLTSLALPLPPPGPEPQATDVSKLTDEFVAANNKTAANANVRREAVKIRQNVADQVAEINRLELSLGAAKDLLVEFRKIESEMNAECEALADPDLSSIQRQISEAGVKNKQAEAWRTASAAAAAAQADAEKLGRHLEAKKSESDSLTAKIADIDKKKEDLLQSVQVPYPGMTVDGDEVLVNGIPFVDASTMEKLRVGLAMGAAMKPEVRVVILREGSLFDDAHLRLVEEWAEANDFQVLAEVVSNDRSGVGIVIEDGEVVRDAASAAEAEAEIEV